MMVVMTVMVAALHLIHTLRAETADCQMADREGEDVSLQNLLR